MISKSKPNGGEQGYILIWVMFYFALFYLLAVSFMDASIMENLISINHSRDIQAFAMADGGALMGAEQIYSILNRDYRASREIPEQLTLAQKKWIFSEQGRNMSFELGNPRCISQGDGECSFQFYCQGDYAPAQKLILVEVRVRFIDYYGIQIQDGSVQMVFDRRFIYPAQITSMDMQRI